MAGSFDGKVALATGGNSGIGKATAFAFAHEAARVVVAARRTEEGERTVDEIRQKGGQALFVRADVALAGEVEKRVHRTALPVDDGLLSGIW